MNKQERLVTLHRVVNVMWLGVIAIEIILGLRFILKLIAANPNAPFAELMYAISAVFIVPFEGLTVTPSANGAVLEIFTLVAMLVYLLFGWLVTKLVWTLFRPAKTTSGNSGNAGQQQASASQPQ